MKYLEAEGLHNPLVAPGCGSSSEPANLKTRLTDHGTRVRQSTADDSAGLTGGATCTRQTPVGSQSAYALLLDPVLLRLRKPSRY